MSRILLGVPCMETVPVEFVNCLLRLKKPQGTEIMLFALSAVDIAREKISQYALDNKFDYVLFIDSDMVFPSDTILRLLEHDKDIVSGLAFQRKPPYSPCIYQTLRFGEAGDVRSVPCKEYERGLIEVEGCGMACCLIKTEVMLDIYKSGQYLFNPLPGYGEDLSFCLRARKLDHKIYADTTLQIGHLGHMICTEETWKNWNEVSR